MRNVTTNGTRFILLLSVALTSGAMLGACSAFSSTQNSASGGASGSGGTGEGGTTSAAGGSTGSGGAIGGGGSPGGSGGTRSLTGAGGATTTASAGAVGGGGASTTGTVPGTGGTPVGGATGLGGGPGGGATGSGGASSPATSGAGGTAGSTGTTSAAETPCGILAAAGNTCAAAHSTVRVIYPGYTGPLYQVCKGSSQAGQKSCLGTTQDIGSVAGGVADSAAQDSFCSGGATCTISAIYDQSPNGNDLYPSPPGGAKGSADNPANASDLKTTLGGHEVYGIYIKPNPGMGYRSGCTGCTVVKPKGTATGDQAETEYMITSKNGVVDGCCFDYGNAETDSHDDNNGTMEAVYFGAGVVWGTGSPGGHNNGTSWVEADLENGLYAGWSSTTQDQDILTNTPLNTDFVTAVVVGDSCTGKAGCAGTGSSYPNGRFALYGGDATTGTLKTMYDGIRPAKTGYVPMLKQGSIILGTGGDNSDGDGGQWFEGAMASGAATVDTLNALQANIVAAGYGK